MIKLLVETRDIYPHSTNYGGLDRLTFFHDNGLSVRKERNELRNALRIFALDVKILVYCKDENASGSDVHVNYYVYETLTRDALYWVCNDRLDAWTDLHADDLIARGTIYEDENRPTEYLFTTTVGELFQALTYPIREE